MHHLGELKNSSDAVPSAFHVGIVVTDVAEAMTEFGHLLGMRWGRIQHRVGRIETSRGTCEFATTFALSLDGPLHCELIGRRSETPWADLGLHHLALWCDDFAQETEHRTALGWRWDAGKYFFAPDGTRYELVPRAEYQPRVTRYQAGGNFFEA